MSKKQPAIDYSHILSKQTAAAFIEKAKKAIFDDYTMMKKYSKECYNYLKKTSESESMHETFQKVQQLEPLGKKEPKQKDISEQNKSLNIGDFKFMQKYFLEE